MAKKPNKYLISIATNNRIADLRRMIASLEAADVQGRADVVIVDNAIDLETRELVEASGYLYLEEAEPGIPHARNRGLSRFSSDYKGIIFVDDDEWVDAGWFHALTTCADESGSGVITGPVVTVLPDDTPRWIRRGGFLQRPSVPTGTRLLSAATNNTLLKRSAWIAAGSPHFDPRYVETGGSDWDFFWGIRRAGAEVSWCDEAVVMEDVPSNRLKLRWITRRSFRSGMVHVMVRRKYGDPLLLPILRGGMRAIYNLALMLLDVFRGKGVKAKYYNAIMFEMGRMSELFGVRVYEYSKKNS